MLLFAWLNFGSRVLVGYCMNVEHIELRCQHGTPLFISGLDHIASLPENLVEGPLYWRNGFPNSFEPGLSLSAC
jgi:hypothetical protein